MKTLVSLVLAVVVAVTALAVPAVAENFLDVRYGFDREGNSLELVEVYKTEGKVTMPDILYISLPGYEEVDLGAGYTFMSSKELSLTGYAYLSTATGGQSWITPSLYACWNKGKLSADAFVLQYEPLNDNSPKMSIVFPAHLLYQLDEKWQAGIGAVSYKIEGVPGEEAKCGPTLRYYERNHFYEGQVYFREQGGPEFQLRFFTAF